MEKMNEKVAIPPPAYNDSDAGSIIKPEKSAFEDNAPEPLPVWQNNVLLRSSRRRLAFGGVVSTIVILAIILGVLGSLGFLARKESVQNYRESDPSNSGAGAFCTKWAYKNVPRMGTDLDDMSNKWCVTGGSNGGEYVRLGSPFPGNNDAVCAAWIPTNSQTTAQLKKALDNHKSVSWDCYDWEQPTATTTVGSTTGTPSAVDISSWATTTAVISVYTAGGAALKAGGVLGAIALIVPSFIALVL